MWSGLGYIGDCWGGSEKSDRDMVSIVAIITPALAVKEYIELIPQIHIIITKAIGRIHHRRINIAEAPGTCYINKVPKNKEQICCLWRMK